MISIPYTIIQQQEYLLIDYTTSVNFENNYDKEMSQKLSAEVRLDLPLGSMKLLDENVVNTMVGRYEYNSFKFYYVELDPQEIEELAFNKIYHHYLLLALKWAALPTYKAMLSQRLSTNLLMEQHLAFQPQLKTLA